MLYLSQFAILGLATISLAHPGEHHSRNDIHELAKREFKVAARRGLEACAGKLEARGYHTEAASRRAAKVETLRHRRGLLPSNSNKRDAVDVDAKSHLSTAGYTFDTPESTLFASNGTCILNPEGETGPFYVKGELIREDLTGGEPGVPITIEGQFIDVETCEPITEIWWDVWNCNSTGVYSGVQSMGNGNSNDASNLDNTALRGIGKADEYGVVTFDSIFPGHYSGRATHHHIVAHLDATVLENGTLTGGTVAHVGQLFWDQDLITAVEATAPYNTNSIAVTENIDDRVFYTETDGTESDPVFEYVYVGDELADGLFGWITIAVNSSATYDPKYSFTLTANGGVAQGGGTGMKA
ncbi:Intradiol ring-cleavage dioxygenase [Pseudomassariella vexata]|uniref:Intradiol ring-cleavage dioxygenase n=1 Tax=Pseudomassariella vexata TaxID=1141098 RepID=A0A1Y2DA52_9PEZI|nr:Intradiol ring-cleavage dioxygenase [Pseudomassariella vexata]ORY56077.1 Intradiol ring-cleavage dioxygenase [Pseudomassariella vexata]